MAIHLNERRKINLLCIVHTAQICLDGSIKYSTKRSEDVFLLETDNLFAVFILLRYVEFNNVRDQSSFNNGNRLLANLFFLIVSAYEIKTCEF